MICLDYLDMCIPWYALAIMILVELAFYFFAGAGLWALLKRLRKK